MDFDSRAMMLTQEIREDWEPTVKELHHQNRRQIQESLIHAFGASNYKGKRQNYIDLGTKPFSIMAFHNAFFEQVRLAFVTGAYYPALTGACALGERILNHLILNLRDDFRATPEYKQVYRKDSFDQWDVPINALESWGVLLPDVAVTFRELKETRNKSIHFRPEVDSNDRQLALDAIKLLSDIIGKQFSAFGPQPWFIKDIPGEIYIRKDKEADPFIRVVYLPNCLKVGYKHEVIAVLPRMTIKDDFAYEDRDITDEEFCSLRKGNGS